MTSRWVYQYISPAASTKTSHRSPRMGWGGQSPPSLEYEIWQRWESSGWWGGVSPINHDNFIAIMRASYSSTTTLHQPQCQFFLTQDGHLVNLDSNFETTVIVQAVLKCGIREIWFITSLACLSSILANFGFDLFSGYWGLNEQKRRVKGTHTRPSVNSV